MTTDNIPREPGNGQIFTCAKCGKRRLHGRKRGGITTYDHTGDIAFHRADRICPICDKAIQEAEVDRLSEPMVRMCWKCDVETQGSITIELEIEHQPFTFSGIPCHPGCVPVNEEDAAMLRAGLILGTISYAFKARGSTNA